MISAAPQPALGLTVGIVGHRPERIVDAPAVDLQIRKVLAAIEAALKLHAGDYGANGPTRLAMVSALAEGADRMAATAALEAGMALEAVLPFPTAEYEVDFATTAARDEFRALLARSGSVLVLDGAADARDRAYDAVGLALLDNCDLLIAVWDGGPGRGRGGTREVIEEAARRAMPVVVISADGAGSVLRTGGAGPMRFADVPERPIGELAAIVAGLADVRGEAADEAWWRNLATLPPEPLVHGAYPLLLRCAGLAQRRSRRPQAQAAPAPEQEPLAEAFAWWDFAAIRGAQAFRSAVIVNFGLAALAIVLAATSVLGGAYKWLFVVAEIVTILALLANAYTARRRRWQDRWLESREVAELLRVAVMLRHVGIARGLPGGEEGGWIGRYAAALARAAAPRAADLSDPVSAAAPLVAEVASQAGWNASTSTRMHLASHRIGRFGEVLFALVLAAATAWLALYFSAPQLAARMQYALTAVTAGLPAIATASYGIRIILDFAGIAERAQRLATGLDGQLARWEAGPRTAAALQDFARRTADIMLGDVAAWRLLAEGRRLTIPG